MATTSVKALSWPETPTKNLSEEIANELSANFADGTVEFHIFSGCLFVIQCTKNFTHVRKVVGFQHSATALKEFLNRISSLPPFKRTYGALLCARNISKKSKDKDNEK